jgi:hypothetical protein
MRRLSFLLLAAAACSDPPGPSLRPCTASGFAVTLAVGQYASIDPAADSGCTVFPANGAVDAEYLVVPQIATGTPGQSLAFRLTGDTIHPATIGPVSAGPAIDRLTPAEAFHTFLRRGDERAWKERAPPGPSPARGAPLPSPESPTFVYGDQKAFKVCSNLTCTTFANVTATARAVKPKVVIFVDNAAPAPPNGLDSTALDSLGTLFETRLYATDTLAFGRESDIDANGAVLVLMTAEVNKLVTNAQCQESGFVAGFFYGGDLLPPGPSNPGTNSGEIFYSLVADPAGALSCVHSTTSVQRIVPVTFIHEFQHMISFNEHVLVRGGNGEVLWLNEGFSHFAEELGGRTYASGTPEFSRFVIGNLFNAYQYLDSTGRHFLEPTAGIGSLAERGAAWLFVRFVVDRFAGDTTVASWNALTRQLVRTTNTGAANIAAVTGQPFQTVVSRWALANWVSDLPAFVAPTELTYDSWKFRTTYASLNAQDANNFPKAFPLTPTTSSGRLTDLSGTLRSGSGVYHRVTQGSNAPGFTLHFTTPGGGLISPTLLPRLNVIRVQ